MPIPTIPAHGASWDSWATGIDSAARGAATPLTPTATKTAPYTAAVGDLAMMNVPGGATVLTLPTAPADKAQVGFRSIGATTAVPLAINRGGSTDTIGTAGATSASIPLDSETGIFQYDAANTRWLLITGFKPLTALDARYVGKDATTVNVMDHGAVASNATDSTTAFAAAVAILEGSGAGGILIIPPGLYAGSFTFAANVPILVLAYGATLYAPASSYGVKAATRPGGASAMPMTVCGLHIKGDAGMTSNGAWIVDSNSVGFVDCYVERCLNGYLIENDSSTIGCEGVALTRAMINNCTTGVRFLVSGGFGGVGSFMQTQLSDVRINNCPTSIYMPAGNVLFRRAVFERVSLWIPDSGVGVYCDADLYQARLEIKAEAYSTGTGCVMVQVGPNSTNWSAADVELGIPAVIPTKFDTTSAATGFTAIWTEGRTVHSLIKGSTDFPFSFGAGNNLRIGSTASLGSNGVGIIEIAQAKTGVSSSPTTGVAVWVSSVNALLVRDTLGYINGLTAGFAVKSANYTTGVGDKVVAMDASGGSRTVTLTAYKGAVVTVIKTDSSANAVGIANSSAGTVDGQASGTVLLNNLNSTGTYACHDGTNFILVGGGPRNLQSRSANYTATASDAIILGTGGAGGITITLPAVAVGRRLVVKKVDAGAGAVTVTPATGTVDGAANKALSAQYASATFISDGTNWFLE